MTTPTFNELFSEPNFYRKIARTLFVGAAACAATVGLYFFISSFRPEQKTYGPYLFGRTEVTYTENSPDGLLFFHKNTMTIKADSVVYECADASGETTIDWQAETKPEFGNDALESTAITLLGEKSTFESSQIDDETLEGKLAGRAFSFLNRKYNSYRSEIREIKRNEYIKEHGALERLLKD